MRCLKDNSSMWDPAIFWGITKKGEKEPFAFVYKCDKCKNRFAFMTKYHPDFGKGNEIQEIKEDNECIMYNGDGTLSKDQTTQFMEVSKNKLW